MNDVSVVVHWINMNLVDGSLATMAFGVMEVLRYSFYFFSASLWESECAHNKHKRKLMCAIFLWCSAWLIKVFWVLTCIRSKPLQYIVCMKTFASDKPFKFIDFLGLQAWYPFLSDGDMQSKLLPAKNYGLRGQGWDSIASVWRGHWSRGLQKLLAKATFSIEFCCNIFKTFFWHHSK